MRPFADISYDAQVKRLKRLALLALLNYDLGEVQLVRLGHGENTTFRVEEVALSVHQSDKCLSSKTQWYVLRIHRPGNHSLAAIRSELLWLSTLRRDTDLVVPEPVPSKDGSLFTVVETEGVPQPRCCVLFRWIPGRFLNAGLSPLALGRVGTLMARLHQHAQQFTLPEGFVRPRLDVEGQFSRCALQLPFDFASRTFDSGAFIRLIAAFKSLSCMWLQF